MEKLESSRLLASKDTEKFRKDSPWWYWGVEVLGGAILGGLGGFIGWKFIPLNASSYKQFIYPTVGSILGFVFGIFVIYYLIFLYFWLGAPYRQQQQLFNSLQKVRKQLQEWEDRQPNMLFAGTGWENVQGQLVNYGTSQIIGKPVFSHAIFANDPKDSRKGITAEKVVAHLEFYSEGEAQPMFVMVGRWSETPERAQVGQRVVETNQIDIAPNGMPRQLDIVIKYNEEADCYGVNNDTPQRAPSDWRDASRKLTPGKYKVNIRLRGTNLDKTFILGLVNEGLGKSVVLSPIIQETNS